MTAFVDRLVAPRRISSSFRFHLHPSSRCNLRFSAPIGFAAPAPVVLTGADRRPSTSLNVSEWASIVDPYFCKAYSASITKRRRMAGS